MRAISKRKAAAYLTSLISMYKIRRHRRPTVRRWWTRPIWRQRDTHGSYESLVKSMAEEDHEYFQTYLRTTPREFKKLCSLLRPELKRYPAGRKALSVGHQLAITLRYLASGDSLKSISFAFRIGFSTAHVVVMRTCKVLWKVLQPLYLPSPTVETWRKVEEGFDQKWNFPSCIGAVDGKHVAIKAPEHSGSLYFNYKGHFSIVLMAVTDGSYKFVVVDIGSYGSNSDGGIWKNSEFGKSFDNGRVPAPPNKNLPGTEVEVPYVMLGDEAFQISPNFLSPYPGTSLTNNERRIFNYRLSRARRCSENTFGICVNRLRILTRPLDLKVENCEIIVKACVVVHNFLMTEAEIHDSAYCPASFADRVLPNGDIVNGTWRNMPVGNLAQARAKLRRMTQEGEKVRETFTQYFSGVGAVDWQNERAHIVHD